MSGVPSTRKAAGGTPISTIPAVDPTNSIWDEETGQGVGAARKELGRYPGLGVSLFCSGDEDQHIYGWRGTTADHLHRSRMRIIHDTSCILRSMYFTFFLFLHLSAEIYGRVFQFFVVLLMTFAGIRCVACSYDTSTKRTFFLFCAPRYDMYGEYGPFFKKQILVEIVRKTLGSGVEGLVKNLFGIE